MYSGRLRLKSRFKVAFTAAIILVAITFTFNTIIGLNNVNSDTKQVYEQITVLSGETIWDIAKENMSETSDIRYAVYEICQLNDITADQLYAGQTLLIPTNI